MTQELKEKIIDETIDFLFATEGGLTDRDQESYHDCIDLHINDYIRDEFAGLSEEEYAILIDETIKEYHSYDNCGDD